MKEYWVRQLETWSRDGTFDRLSKARETSQPVAVRRTSGAISIGIIHGFGYGGRTIEVTFEDGGKKYKIIGTDDFLEANPQFGPSLIELRPKDED